MYVFPSIYCRRYWSLYDAMYYSSYMSSKLVVYKTAGHNKLQVGMCYDDCAMV